MEEVGNANESQIKEAVLGTFQDVVLKYRSLYGYTFFYKKPDSRPGCRR